MPVQPIAFTPDLSIAPEVSAFFDPTTNTVSYVVKDPNSTACAVIDSVLDFDYASGQITYDGADAIIRHIQQHGLVLEWLIETHIHADHLSAAPYIQSILGGRLGIGDQIGRVQATFGKIFNEGTEFARDGSQFDRLFADGDSYWIGSLRAYTLFTPGHTPADMVHVIGNAAFVGDTLFMPDSGSARADFPGGDARTLYNSIQRVLSLPSAMRLFMCHDYAPNGRSIAWESTVAEQREHNIHVGKGTPEQDFVRLREERDRTLAMPRLIIPSLQVNMRGGQMPTADPDGNIFLKVPINVLRGAKG